MRLHSSKERERESRKNKETEVESGLFLPCRTKNDESLHLPCLVASTCVSLVQSQFTLIHCLVRWATRALHHTHRWWPPNFVFSSRVGQETPASRQITKNEFTSSCPLVIVLHCIHAMQHTHTPICWLKRVDKQFSRRAKDADGVWTFSPVKCLEQGIH